LTAYLELADYLLIAEAVLGLLAQLIAGLNRIGARRLRAGCPARELRRC
jgi:hypothetical protein